ncbi:MAG: undecaprenyl-diphosphate phosphatase [Candidatus Omnitrophica bacterium]|nr:undecaprenyl-diphosphate phosphatase [Candidatus Omnitrophota bacterium]
MFEAIILGIIQGITEWIPVSSEGMITLAKINLFHSSASLKDIVCQALFLHLGTFFAALVYFRKDIAALVKLPFAFKESSEENKKIFFFLCLTTIISGLLGFMLLLAMDKLTVYLQASGKIIMILVAILLFITGFLQLNAKNQGVKNEKNLTPLDGWFLGIIQGVAVLPGLSRSGTTIACLLMKGFDKTVALRLSFLMSLPVILAGNIILNFHKAQLSSANLVSLAVSFLVGLVSISLFFKITKKINFGVFVISFAFLVLLSVFI